MEQINFPFTRNLPLKRLVADALVEIERLGYSRRSRRRYQTTWENLVAFADHKHLGDEFSGDLVGRFLEENRASKDELAPGDGWRRHAVWGLKVLADFAEDGHIERAFAEVEAIRLCPPCNGQSLRARHATKRPLMKRLSAACFEPIGLSNLHFFSKHLTASKARR